MQHVKPLSPLSLDQLVTATGGIATPAVGSIWSHLRPDLPPGGPTVPLGPFVPPRKDAGRIA